MGTHHTSVNNPSHLVLELLQEILVKLDESLRPIGARSKESCPEMEGSLLLAKARARNDTDTRSVKHAEAVELVGLEALFLGLCEGLLGEGDGGEEIHGAL